MREKMSLTVLTKTSLINILAGWYAVMWSARVAGGVEG